MAPSLRCRKYPPPEPTRMPKARATAGTTYFEAMAVITEQSHLQGNVSTRSQGTDRSVTYHIPILTVYRLSHMVIAIVNVTLATAEVTTFSSRPCNPPVLSAARFYESSVSYPRRTTGTSSAGHYTSHECLYPTGRPIQAWG